MTSDETYSKIQAVVDQFVGDPSRNFLAPRHPPLDISKPNIHDSKEEFLREVGAVRALIGHLEGYTSLINGLVKNDGIESLEAMTLGRLRLAVDDGAARRVRTMKPESTFDLIQKNAADTGLFLNSLGLIFELKLELKDRLAELEDQEKEFWSVTHRAPNYYARAIARRLARLYANEKGKKPTIGTARDGGHPSTEYGRTLEQIFDLLGIKGRVRGPAEWAIAQLTDDDLQPRSNRNALAGLLSPTSSEAPQNEQGDLSSLMQKPPAK